MPLQIVAHDGGLAPQGVALSTFRHGSAERYEVVIDFAAVPAGHAGGTAQRLEQQQRRLRPHRKGDGIRRRRRPGGHQRPDLEHGLQRDAAGGQRNDVRSTPTGREKVVKLRVQRTGVRVDHQRQVLGTTSSTPNSSRPSPNPRLGETQIWEIENKGGGWFHPVHIHLIDFKILTRNGRPRMAHEAGPKDVVYVGENEKVRLLCKFQTPSNRTGRYMVHCHNLPHEDHDMMQPVRRRARRFRQRPQQSNHRCAGGPRPHLSGMRSPAYGLAGLSSEAQPSAWKRPAGRGLISSSRSASLCTATIREGASIPAMRKASLASAIAVTDSEDPSAAR